MLFKPVIRRIDVSTLPFISSMSLSEAITKWNQSSGVVVRLVQASGRGTERPWETTVRREDKLDRDAQGKQSQS
jgi:hypothetical protein